MQIKRLEIKNCLGIKELELEPGQVNLIKGANESGKTSILEVIEKALRNTQRRTRFVHEGAEEGTLYVELTGGLAIERRVRADGKTALNLTQGGAKIYKPETALKALAGAFSFNPVDFMNCKDKEQTEILLSLLPMRLTAEQLQQWFGEVPPVNLEQHAIAALTYLAEKYFYDRRTIANNEVKQCSAEISALFEQLPDNYDGEAWRGVRIGVLWQEVQAARQQNENREKAAQVLRTHPRELKALEDRFGLAVRQEQDSCRARIDKQRHQVDAAKQGMREEMERISAQIRRLQEELAGLETELHKLEERAQLQEEGLRREGELRVEALLAEKEGELQRQQQRRQQAQTYLQEHAPLELEPLEARAREAETQKGFLPLWENMQRLEKELEQKKERAAELDQCVHLARSLPVQLLAAVKMPVKGLGINEELQLTIDGLPIRNLSTGRQIRLALEIARATSGPLQLICIDRFESLDPINRELFLQEIENDGYQYFISSTVLDKNERGDYRTELQVEARGGAGGGSDAGR